MVRAKESEIGQKDEDLKQIITKHERDIQQIMSKGEVNIQDEVSPTEQVILLSKLKMEFFYALLLLDLHCNF